MMVHTSRRLAAACAALLWIPLAMAQQWSPGHVYNLTSQSATGVSQVLTANVVAPESGDILYVDEGGLELLAGNGRGGVATVPTNVLPNVVRAVSAQFKGSSLDDVIAMQSTDGNDSAARLYLLTSEAHGAFSTPISITIPHTHLTTACTLSSGDLNNDGKPDLILVCPENRGSILVGINKGEGSFAFQTMALQPGKEITSVAIGDFNGDGKTDLLVKSTTDYDTTPQADILWGNGSMIFSLAPQVKVADGQPVTADYNGQLADDLLMVAKQHIATFEGGSHLKPDASIAPDEGCSFVDAQPEVALSVGSRAQNIVALEDCSEAGGGSPYRIRVYNNTYTTTLRIIPSAAYTKGKYVTTMSYVLGAPYSSLPNGTWSLTFMVDGKITHTLSLHGPKGHFNVVLGKGEHRVLGAYFGDSTHAAAMYGFHIWSRNLDTTPTFPRPPSRFGTILPRATHISFAPFSSYGHVLPALYRVGIGQAPTIPKLSSGCAQATAGTSCTTTSAAGTGLTEWETSTPLSASGSSVVSGTPWSVTTQIASAPVDTQDQAREQEDPPSVNPNDTPDTCNMTDPGCAQGATAILDGVAQSSPVTYTDTDKFVEWPTTQCSYGSGAGCYTADTVTTTLQWSSSSIPIGTHTLYFRINDPVYGEWSTQPVTLTVAAAAGIGNTPNAAISIPIGHTFGSLQFSPMASAITSPGPGIISTIAGNGTAGYSGDGGQATSAELDVPRAVAVDSSGNIYVADTYYNVIRKITPAGVISTFAGLPYTGTSSYCGSAFFLPTGSAPATSEYLCSPSGVAVDAAGNVYIADSGNNVIRKVTPSGSMSTFAGDGNSSGPSPGPATSTGLNGPMAVAVDSAGNVYIADYYSANVAKVDTSGNISVVAGYGTQGDSGDGGPAIYADLYYPDGVAVDSSGNIYIAENMGSRIRKVNTSGTISTFVPYGVVSYPVNLAIDTAGNLYIADSGNNVIRKVTPSGTVSTYAGNGTAGYSGDGGPATSAQLSRPEGVAVDSAGNVYIADYNNNRVRLVGGPQVNTSTSLSCSPSTFTYGSTTGSTCTATVSGNSPTGTVTFYFSGGGTWTTLTLSGGTASGNGWYTGNPPMSQGVYAVYNGDSNNNGSTSNTTTVTITKATPSISYSCSPNPITAGGANSYCTATVAGVSGGATPTGTVTMTYNGISWVTLTLSNGSATQYFNNPPGSYTMKAVYNGDGNYNGGESASTSLTVQKATPSLSLSGSSSTISYGSQVTYTAALSGGSSPTGTIDFQNNGSTACTITLSGSSAACTVGAGWAPGSYTITASYSGDSNNNAANSNAVTLTITKLTPTVTASCSPNPVTSGSTYTCTASVSGGATGSVTFPSTFGGQTVNLSGGSATTSAQTAASPGTYSGTGTYNGDAYNNAVSFALSLTEVKATPTVSLAAKGVSLTFNAQTQLAHSMGQADGEGWSCSTSTCTATAGSMMTYGPYTTAIGPGQYVATFVMQIDSVSGNNDQIALIDVTDNSGGTILAQAEVTRNQFAAPYTYQTFSLPFTLSSAPSGIELRTEWLGNSYLKEQQADIYGVNPSPYGKPVALSATVTGASAMPTGNVTFYSNGTLLGTAPITTCGDDSTICGGNYGTATFMPSTLPAGADSITAKYSGDSNYTSVTSAGVTQTINGPTPTIAETPSSSLNPSQYGQSVTFSSLLNTDGVSPAGGATFSSGGASLGSGTLSAISTTNLLSDSEDLTGSPWWPYCATAGNNWRNVTKDTTAVAAPDGTQTATSIVTPTTETCGSGEGWGFVETNTAGMQSGQPYTSSVWLRGAVGGETVSIGFNDCYETNVTLSTSWQRYSYSTSSYPSACGNGDRGFQVTILTTGATVYLWGAQLENSATAGPYVPTLGQSASGSGAMLSYSTSTLPVGSHSIVASYTGDSSTGASTSPKLTQTVSTGTATASIESSAPTSTYGQSVTFTCSVTAYGSPVVDGTPITFTVDGSTASSTTTTGGNATWSSSTLAIGSHTIACQTGGSGYTPTSASMTQTVTIGQAAVTVTSGQNPSTYGTPVTFTATVSGGGGTPTGTVQFEINGTACGSAAPLSSSGAATFQSDTTNGCTWVNGGSDTITAVYGGDVNYAGTSGTFTETVNPVALPWVLQSLDNPGAVTQPVTFEAVMDTSSLSTAGNVAVPTGTVTFYDGATVIGTVAADSPAFFTTSSLALGTHNITAVYTGDQNYQPATSAQLTETIVKETAISSINVDPSSTVAYGTPVTFTDVLSTYGSQPTGSVTFKDGVTTLGSGTVSAVSATNLLIQSNGFSVATRAGGDIPSSGRSGTSYSMGKWLVEAPSTTTARGTVQAVAYPTTSAATVTGPSGAPISLGGAQIAYPDTSSGGQLGSLYSGVVENISTTALAGKAATFSVWLESASTSPATVTLYLGYTTSGTTAATATSIATQTCALTSTWTRCSVTGDFPATSSNATVSMRSWGATAETVNAWGAQLEQAAAPGPYVQTTTAAATGSGGVATFTTVSPLSVGSHTITAAYGGDADFTSSTSPSASVTVNKALVSISAVGNPNPSAHNQTVTFTVTVAPPSGVATVPTGTVTILNGSTTIGTGTLNSSGVATIVTSALPTGSDQLTVRYAGDTNYY